MKRTMLILLAVFALGAQEPKVYREDGRVFTVAKEQDRPKSSSVWIILEPPVNKDLILQALNQVDVTRWQAGKRHIGVWAYSNKKNFKDLKNCGYLFHVEGGNPERTVTLYLENIK